MNLHRLNIGIIGGGIGGVAAAVALHRAGIDATVYERAPELREVGAGMMLWPNATRVLKELGLLDRVAAWSGPNRHFLVRSSAGTILMDIGLGHFEVPALCTRRSDLLDALLSALPLERVRLGHDFEYFEQQKYRVGVHFAGGVSAEHDFVIGADGIRSRVRSQLLGVHEPIYRGYTVWRGLAQPDGRCSVRLEQRNLGTRKTLRHPQYRRRPVHLVRHGEYRFGSRRFTRRPSAGASADVCRMARAGRAPDCGN